MNESDQEYLADMLDQARFAIALLGTGAASTVAVDRTVFYALCHTIQTIGEAANQISLESRVRLNSIPWQKIIAMRNRLVHGYRTVAEDLVFGTARDDLPPLVATLRQVLEEDRR